MRADEEKENEERRGDRTSFSLAYGILSSLYGVCGFAALAGRRITTEGTERVADRLELSSQRRSGLRVLVLSAAFAALATALFVLAS